MVSAKNAFWIRQMERFFYVQCGANMHAALSIDDDDDVKKSNVPIKKFDAFPYEVLFYKGIQENAKGGQK